MSARLEGDARKEWRAHWSVVLAASSGMGMAAVVSYAGGLFIAPLEKEFGWSRTDIASAHLISAIATILLAPFVGYLVDRFGPRRIGIAAVIAVCGALSMFSLTTANIWSWRLLWVVMAAANVIVQPMIWTSAITGMFSAGRGLALAVVLCGSSLCSIITPPLTYWLIESYGWRVAWIGIAVSWGMVVLPLVLLFFTSAPDKARRDREPTPISARPTFLSSFRGDVLTWNFMQLALAGFCIAIAVVSMAVTIVPILSSNGLSRGEAAGIASLLGFAAIAGRLTIGHLLDRFEGRFIAAAAVAMPVIGSLILITTPASVPAAAAAVLIFGLSLGAELDIMAYLTSRYFKAESFGMMFGTIGGFVGLAGATGPVILNWVYDLTQSYIPALWGILPVCLISATLFLMMGPYPEKKP